jgi:hypothetical protein
MSTDDAFQNPPIHGTEDGAAWFRAKLEELGESQRGLAKILKRYGDDRQFETIVRHISRIATGQARVPGEMRALLNMMQRGKDRSEKRRIAGPDCGSQAEDLQCALREALARAEATEARLREMGIR